MVDPIRHVSTGTPGGPDVAANKAPSTSASPLVNSTLRQFIQHSPVLAPVDALQSLVGKSHRSVTVAALFPDTAVTQSQAKGPFKAQGNQPLQSLSMAELQRLGAQKDKTAFFQALLPGALESERTYGVPASVILAQAALESGWGKHAIGGYNLFGIKGEGTAGSREAWTSEVQGGRKVRVKAKFAQFNSFAEAVREHGQVFHNGKYDRALSVFKQSKDPNRFIDAMASTYATSKTYAPDLKAMLDRHGLRALCQQQGGH
jgi:flagellum-specific peptidoglycan hydrolase FlgJ